jgi:uncharacterized protein (TIGR02147 family)
VAVADLHREMLTRASEALDTVPRDERQFATVSLTLPEAAVGELKRSITRFVEETTGRYAEGNEARERVYQLSVQLIPLSGRTTLNRA